MRDKYEPSAQKNPRDNAQYRVANADGHDVIPPFASTLVVGEDDRVTDRKQRDDVHNVDGCRGAKDRCEALVLAVTAFGQS